MERNLHIGFTAAAIASQAGLDREVFVITDGVNRTLSVMDGVSLGGIPLARKDLRNVALATTTVAGIMSATDKTKLDSLGATALPRSYLSGLNVTFNSTTVFNSTAGVCRSDDNSVDMSLGSTFTKTLGTAWAVGTGQGALDTGVIGNNWYHVFAIYNPTLGQTDILASLSATAPALPSNWTKQRRIFSLLRSGGVISQFFHQSGFVLWNTPVQTTPISVALSGTVPTLNTLIGLPTGIRTLGQGIVNMSATAANGYTSVFPGDITTGASQPTNNGNDMASTNNAASGNASYPFYNILTNLSGQLGFMGNNVAGNAIGAVYVGGYFDPRGRDD